MASYNFPPFSQSIYSHPNAHVDYKVATSPQFDASAPRIFDDPLLPPVTSFAVPLTPATSSGPNTESTVSFSPSPRASTRRNAPKMSKRAARKADPKYAPRPPNCFMIFRSELVASEKAMKKIERDHRQISRIAGQVWNSLTPAEQKVYADKAKAAKDAHALKHPDYQYAPQQRARQRRKTKRNDPDDLMRNKEVAKLVRKGKSGAELEAAVKLFDERIAAKRNAEKRDAEKLSSLMTSSSTTTNTKASNARDDLPFTDPLLPPTQEFIPQPPMPQFLPPPQVSADLAFPPAVFFNQSYGESAATAPFEQLSMGTVLPGAAAPQSMMLPLSHPDHFSSYTAYLEAFVDSPVSSTGFASLSDYASSPSDSSTYEYSTPAASSPGECDYLDNPFADCEMLAAALSRLPVSAPRRDIQYGFSSSIPPSGLTGELLGIDEGNTLLYC